MIHGNESTWVDYDERERRDEAHERRQAREYRHGEVRPRATPAHQPCPFPRERPRHYQVRLLAASEREYAWRHSRGEVNEWLFKSCARWALVPVYEDRPLHGSEMVRVDPPADRIARWPIYCHPHDLSDFTRDWHRDHLRVWTQPDRTTGGD